MHATTYGGSCIESTYVHLKSQMAGAEKLASWLPICSTWGHAMMAQQKKTFSEKACSGLCSEICRRNVAIKTQPVMAHLLGLLCSFREASHLVAQLQNLLVSICKLSCTSWMGLRSRTCHQWKLAQFHKPPRLHMHLPDSQHYHEVIWVGCLWYGLRHKQNHLATSRSRGRYHSLSGMGRSAELGRHIQAGSKPLCNTLPVQCS